RIFQTGKVRPKLSGGGLITRQLLSRLGGVSNARVFKIPGVRRLLKTFGPNDTVTRDTALQLIGAKDTENPDAKFGDYEDLYIERRDIGSKLTPAMVFAYLAAKGLFRMGFDITCPTCRLK